MLTYYITVVLVIATTFTAQYGHSRQGAAILEKRKTRTYKIAVFMTGVILVCVAGLRYRVGTDYNSYALGYENAVRGVWEHIKTFDEPGINVIAWLGSLLYDDFATMFFVASLVTVVLNVKTIEKWSNNFFIGILLYIFIGAWHGSFNGVRQYLAAAVLFAGHRYMYDRKFWKYLLVILIAMSFHRTALIMLPVYFVSQKKTSWKGIGVIIIATIVMRYSYDSLFSIMSTFKGAEQSEYTYMQTEVNAVRILVAFAPLLLAMMLPKQSRQQSETAFYINLLIVNAALMFATSSSAYLARVGIYTDIYATIAFPKIIRGFTPQSRIILSILILILYGLFWYYELSVRDAYNNFQWIFSR